MIQPDLDKNGFPNREGVYLVKEIWGFDDERIDVYEHPIKGLCCFAPDFGSGGTGGGCGGVNDETDCHVSVQNTGLEFISRVGDLK